jgi:hypothetical protein
MNLFANVPRPIAWVLRIAGWTVGLAIIGAIVVWYGNFKIAHHITECLQAHAHANTNALRAAQQLLQCADTKSGPLERLLLSRNRKALAALPNAPCQYVGTWTATRPGAVYRVTLKDDGEFVAQPLQSPSRDVITGSWGVYKNAMIWLYDTGQAWPPDINDIRPGGADAFALVEPDRSLTQYALHARAPSQNCPSQKLHEAQSAPGPAAAAATSTRQSDETQLYVGYVEAFRVLGRARACQQPVAEPRLKEFLNEITVRHGDNSPMLTAAMLGFVAGNENRLAGNEKDQSVAPTPVPCDAIARQMGDLRLPDVPASLRTK